MSSFYLAEFSTEHEVSCISAASILLNIDKEKYDIIPVGITKDGCWKLCDNCDIELIKNAKWADEKNLKKAVLSPDRKDRSLLVFSNEGIKAMPVDCVFAVIHGAMGEDGTLQGLFEISGIPYVGSGVCSSAMSMDKSVTKIIVSDLGIRQASYELVKYSNFLKNADNIITKTMLRLKGFPVFVKPASNGSSVGISRAKDKEELYKAIETAGKYDEKILVEEAIVGQEVEVAVLGTIDPVASVVGEVVPPDRFYDYKSKYIDDTAKLYIPARISNEAAEKLRVAAVKIFQGARLFRAFKS